MRFATDSPANDSARRLRHLSYWPICIHQSFGMSRDNGVRRQCVSLGYIALCKCRRATKRRIASALYPSADNFGKKGGDRTGMRKHATARASGLEGVAVFGGIYNFRSSTVMAERMGFEPTIRF